MNGGTPINLLVISNDEAGSVRVVDFNQLGYVTAAIAATATPALPPAGQIMFTTTTGTNVFQIGKNYAFTALPPTGNGHTFTPKAANPATNYPGGVTGSLAPIFANTITDVRAIAYQAATVFTQVIDATTEVVLPLNTYEIRIVSQFHYKNQVNEIVASYNFSDPLSTPTATQLMAALALQFNANTSFTQQYTLTVVGPVMTITAKQNDNQPIAVALPWGFTSATTSTTTSGAYEGEGTTYKGQDLERLAYAENQSAFSTYYTRNGGYQFETLNGCFYDTYIFTSENKVPGIVSGNNDQTVRSYLLIQRDPAQPTIANPNANLMAVKTMLRNYFNNKYGFSLLPNVANDNTVATGIWGA